MLYARWMWQIACLIEVGIYHTQVLRDRQYLLGIYAANNKKASLSARFLQITVAEWTGLEPATPGVTGRYSNQLNSTTPNVA